MIMARPAILLHLPANLQGSGRQGQGMVVATKHTAGSAGNMSASRHVLPSYSFPPGSTVCLDAMIGRR